MVLAEPARQALLQVLAAAREQHFLGPGDVAAHVEHSLAFTALVTHPPSAAVDLGSGAGIPGLVLALVWPASSWVLLDANVRRTGFLRDAVESLGLAERVEVLAARAEVAGRDPARRAAADLVVARAFGPPAVVAECAAPLLRPGGAMVVAEPPGGAPERWSVEGLGLLGLAESGRMSEPVALVRLEQVGACPDRYPRRIGIPLKRPLF
ncbi:MAG: rRNA (guanine527-N7)-methyltransferase [Acidimicrobiaceae bacterium]|nr:rRNA (guanine527-N7)-methyltransferase [Acidimicrobiaceae bacterium]MDQ1370811.1 rRNA (guanine527-N7)-methyltransferase [Acidimicrobiaceae bacterium]